MRNKLIVSCAVMVTAFLLATNPVVAQAAHLITGGQIKNNSVTGQDIKESSLGAVPKANALTPLKSGQTQSGAFSAAAGDTASGYLGFGITYPRALSTAIADDKIIDTYSDPHPAKCPGAGHAARGYLCLYFDYHNSVDYTYGYSTDAPYNALSKSVGVGLYAVVNGATPYIDGIWTVTAP
ncbi:hypothetical protein [Nocardioides sp.]|uniref:hypothetical protein n=1 Tax=Nocardioides sp. TaxID=35761 RepID=UPI0031FEF36F|nr:hypothetical protein [Nocardioides sp.]